MTRPPAQRLADVRAAAAAISEHVARFGLDDGLVFDAVRMRLIEIGEALKGVDDETAAALEVVPLRAWARMRDRLAHRYWDTLRSIVAQVVSEDLPALLSALDQLES